MEEQVVAMVMGALIKARPESGLARDQRSSGESPWRLSKGEAASGVAWLCWTMQATPGRVLLPREPCLGPSSLAIYACLDARIGRQQAYWEKPCSLSPGIFLLLWLLREETAHCNLYQIRRPSSSCVS